MLTVGPYTRYYTPKPKPQDDGVDLIVQDEGTLVLLRPVSQRGRDFIAEHAPDGASFFGTALVVEHRYADVWIGGAAEHGLTLY